MFTSLQALADGAPSPDVLVVGSGPAGLALTRDLLAGGMSVLLLDSGGRYRADDALNDHDSCGLPFAGGSAGRARVFGGAGQRWSGQCLPLDEVDLTARPWVAGSGWPLDPAVLGPWVRQAEELLLVPGRPNDLAPLSRPGVQAPGFQAGTLEWRSIVYSPRHRLGSRLRRELSREPGVRVVTGATVTRVVVGPGGTTTAVECVGRGGPRTLRAARVVLCCGAIENARLLLHSDVGTGSGHVGRGFQDHPWTMPAEVVDGVAALDDVYQSVWTGGFRYRPKTALAAAAQERHGCLNAVVDLELVYDQTSPVGAAKRLHHAVRERQAPEDLWADLATLLAHPGAPGRLLASRLRAGSGDDGWVATSERPLRRLLRVQTEQPPYGESSVTLSPRQDRFGLPLPLVRWQVGREEWQTTRAAVEVATEELARCGLGEVRPFGWLADLEAWRRHVSDYNHHAGTTRMAAAAEDGVVDPDCRVHGTDGLYVCGGSVFPTSGWANPTLTIVALAQRLADHLLTRA